MKVLHVFKTYDNQSKGGVEQTIFQLAEKGFSYGIESEVYYLDEKEEFLGRKYRGHKINASKRNFNFASTAFSIGAFRDFKHLSKKFDLIHYHFPWPFMDLLHFSCRVRVPSVVTYHSDIVKQKKLMKFYNPLMNAFLTSVDRIIATSPNYKYTSPVLKGFLEKTEVVPIGLDEEFYKVESDELAIIEERSLPKRFFLFVGALRYYKGLRFLLAAVEKTQLPVVLAGNGPLYNEILNAKNKGLYKSLFLLGQVSDSEKNALYQACTAVIFPSHLRSEAFGVSLLEGALFGKPLICCEIGTGTTFINIDGVTGRVVAPCDPESLADAMVDIFTDRDQAKRMGQEARHRFLKKFTAEKMVLSYKAIYEDVLRR